MFLLIIVLPHWSERVIRRRFQAGDSMDEIFNRLEEGQSVLLAMPHSVLMEGLTLIPLLSPIVPQITGLYRELDLPAAETYVHRARERWGASMVARKEGLLRAKKALAGPSGGVGLLFDQSSGHRGHLTLFFNRVCATSNLPGILAAKTRALPLFLETRRIGFWRGVIQATELAVSKDPAEIMVQLHEELEKRLAADDETCASWFWAHKRWKGLQRGQILAFYQRKSYLDEQLRLTGRDELPRQTRFALRLDPRPALLPAAGRLLQVIRSQRPDAVFWLLVPAGLAEEDLPSADKVFTLPSDARERRREIQRIDDQFIDVLFSLDPSADAVQENRRFHCEFSTGVHLAGTRNPYKYGIPTEAETYERDPWAVWCERLPELGAPPEMLNEPS